MLGPSLLPPTVYADAETKNYMTIDEILAYNEQIATESATICGDDYDCYEWLDRTRMEEDFERYELLNVFHENSLIITSINPATETMKLLYQDEDFMSLRMGMPGEKQDLAHVYMFWVDSTGEEPRGPAYADYAYNAKNGIFQQGLHPIYFGDEETYGPKWFTPNVENEVSIAGSNFAENTSGIIYYTSQSHGYSAGVKNVGSCFEHPDYHLGMECRIVFQDGWYQYLPFDVTVESEPKLNPDPTSDPVSPTSDPVEPDPTSDPTSGSTSGSTSNPTPNPEVEPTTDPSDTPSDSSNPDESAGKGGEATPVDNPTQSTTENAPEATPEPEVTILPAESSSESQEIALLSAERASDPEPVSVYAANISPIAEKSSNENDDKADSRKSAINELAANSGANLETNSEANSEHNKDLSAPRAGTNETNTLANFPWLVLAIILAGIGVTVYLLVPKKRKKR